MKSFKEVYELGTDEYAKHTKKMTPGQEVKERKRSKADDDAVKAFLAKGGKIKKLPPGKAQGYHGKDDLGKDTFGMLSKSDSGKFKKGKKVRSMRAQNEEAQIDEATNLYTDDRVGFQIDRFAMGKGKRGFQINYGKVGRYIQVPENDMKRVIKIMTQAMKAK